MKKFFVVLLFASSLFAQTKAIRPDEFRDITYLTASGQEQKLDVYQNTARSAAPVLVYFHGGAWWKGERPKSWTSFRSFVDKGFSVVSVDYRLAGVAPAPAGVQDARCALAWVKANAKKYNFDVSRVVVYGTSAGGHLALMAGMLPTPSDVDLPQCADVPQAAAILDFYGIPDVGRWLNVEHKSPQASSWLGEGDGREALAKKMSPVTYIRPNLPPIFIVHGDADPVVPHQQSIEFQKALETAKAPSELYLVPGGEHGKFNDEEKSKLMKQVFRFLKDHGIIK